MVTPSMNVPERLKSRKFWVAIVSAVTGLGSDLLDLGIDPETRTYLATVIGTYLVGQSAVDWAKARENASKYAAWMATQMGQVTNVQPGGDTLP